MKTCDGNCKCNSGHPVPDKQKGNGGCSNQQGTASDKGQQTQEPDDGRKDGHA